MALFNEQINNWQDWGRLFQSIPVFTPLIGYIMTKENLPATEIENLTPGTNGVFKAGNFVIKIFAPPESGYDQSSDIQTELFAMARARDLGVAVPKTVAHGAVDDRYRFQYIITEYISGTNFYDAADAMTDDEKTAFGTGLRSITDKLNKPCRPFNDIDVLYGKDRQWRWDKFPESFRAERLAYIKSRDYGEFVFCHGDIGGDNIIISRQGGIYIIDFADAVLAPVIYEHELIATDMFTFDPAFLRGFFGTYTVDELAGLCFDGLLIHDFGADTIEEHIGRPDGICCLDDLRDRIKQKIVIP